MLILTRNLNERLIIGDNIIISILGIKGGQIRLGIDAPKDVPVNREEIWQKIQAEKNKQAVDADFAAGVADSYAAVEAAMAAGYPDGEGAACHAYHAAAYAYHSSFHACIEKPETEIKKQALTIKKYLIY